MIFLTLALAAPQPMPTHDLYADDGESRDAGPSLSFAVVGDTRGAGPVDRAMGRVPSPGVEEAVVGDVAAAIADDDLEFVVLLGNMVAGSKKGNWRAFAADWHAVLKGTELSDGGPRVPVVPVAGTQDRVGDEWLKEWQTAFPNAGADIGFNRVASWYRFDVEVGGSTWRMLVVDSDREALGSRWSEQLAWLPPALEGEYDGLLVFMNQPLITLGTKSPSNEGEGPRELLAVIDDATKVGRLRAVFAANAGTNEVFLPGGKFGELFVNTNSGAPAATQARWGHAEPAGIPDIQLEPIFDLALVREFDRAAAAVGFSEQVIDHAKARGSYEGFVGEYDARSFPVQGWWNVRVTGDEIAVTFRMVGHDGTVRDVYTANNSRKVGWKIGG